MESGAFAEGAAIAWACIPGAQQAGLHSIEGRAYHLLAGASFNTQDFDQAMLFARSAFQAYQKAGNMRGMGSAYQIAGIMMLATKQLDSAFYFAQESARFYEAAGDPVGVALAYTRMGHVFNLKEEYEQATPYYLKSYEISRSDTLSEGFMSANLSLASNYNYRKQYDLALRHALKAYEIAQKRNSFYEKNTALEYLSYIYEQIGDYKQALTFGRLFKMTQDSVLNEERIRQVKELEIKYETAEKQTAIQLLEKDKASQRILLWAGAFILLILTAGIILVTRFYRQRSTALALVQQETEQRLKAEQREAERLGELDAFKSRFFTNISHEFRTPLTVILGMAEQLGKRFGKGSGLPEGAASAEIGQVAVLIQRNGEHLLHLINQILDLAKLEANSLEMNYVQGDVAAYVPYLAESLRSLAEERSVLLSVEAPETPVVMDHDPERLRQVIHNLLSNAIKFTDHGGQVSLRMTLSEPNQPNALTISVSDTGSGIAPEDLPKIFDRFYQAGNAPQIAAGGSGIGLSLTRELVRAMGGAIRVASEAGKGTTFTVTLPVNKKADTRLELPLAPKQAGEQAATNHQEFTAHPPSTDDLPSLLIVEDNPDVAEYLRLCLKEKYQVTLAINGREGIEKAIETVPDLILSDVMMPEKDGLEVCDALKNDEHTSHIPIVLLTAKADVESRLAGLRRGADVYLSKPFHQEELHLILANLLDQRRKWQDYFGNVLPPAESRAPAVAAPPDLDLEDAFLKKIRQQLEAQLEDPDFDGPRLAKAMLLSEVQLYRKIKALTGKSTALYLRSVRLQKGRELLRTTKRTVSEIAYDVGFEDPNYFSRTFAQEFGLAPSEMRK